MISIALAPHPLFDPGALAYELAQPIDALSTAPQLADWLVDPPASPAPVARPEATQKAIRDLLRHGGFKPSGRNKPASEYLRKAAAEGLRRINAVVDACNAVSLQSGLPISVVDLGRTEGQLTLGVAPAESRYVFNPAGQEIDVSGLLGLADAAGPCANGVKDAQRTKTDGETRRILVILWGTSALEGATEAATDWLSELLSPLGTPLDVTLEPS